MANKDNNYPQLVTASLIPAPNSTGGESDESGIDLWEYLRIVRRRWLIIALTAVVCVGLTAIYTLRLTKIYRATNTIRIEALDIEAGHLRQLFSGDL